MLFSSLSRHSASKLALLLAVAGSAPFARAAQTDPVPHVATPYGDRSYQTKLPFGSFSHWLQPWRAWQETRPANSLLNGVGINLNVPPENADAVCKVLSNAGFKHVRIEIGWDQIRYDDPTKLRNPDHFRPYFDACKRWHLRPLILLNVNQAAPGPTLERSITLPQPAKAGSRTLQIKPADLATFVRGRSGLSYVTPSYWAAEILFTDWTPDGLVTLAKPLPKDLSGEVRVHTMRFLPLYATGTPEANETYKGYADYARAVVTLANSVLGSGGCDVETFNEVSFGSAFLNIENYYEKDKAPSHPGGNHFQNLNTVAVAALAGGDGKTVPFPGVGVSDGIGSQWPWSTGDRTYSPPGIAALNKHPYHGLTRFTETERGTQTPVDAQGNPYNMSEFAPVYNDFFPEWFLNAGQTEYFTRDISPVTTPINGIPHGRFTHPFWPDGRPAPTPAVWITEVNLTADGSPHPVSHPNEFQAKATLRYLTWLHRGTERLYFYAARDNNPNGFGLLKFAENDPGKPMPTLATAALKRYLGRHAVVGAVGPSEKREIKVTRIAENHNLMQFQGSPKDPVRFPPLYDRDCVAVFPVQTGPRNFEVTLYVMTRDLSTPLGEENYEITLTGFTPRAGVTPVLYDPIRGTAIPAAITVKSEGQVAVRVRLTDYPRVLRLETTGANPADSRKKPAKTAQKTAPQQPRSVPKLKNEGSEIDRGKEAVSGR